MKTIILIPEKSVGYRKYHIKNEDALKSQFVEFTNSIGISLTINKFGSFDYKYISDITGKENIGDIRIKADTDRLSVYIEKVYRSSPIGKKVYFTYNKEFTPDMIISKLKEILEIVKGRAEAELSKDNKYGMAEKFATDNLKGWEPEDRIFEHPETCMRVNIDKNTGLLEFQYPLGVAFETKKDMEDGRGKLVTYDYMNVKLDINTKEFTIASTLNVINSGDPQLMIASMRKTILIVEEAMEFFCSLKFVNN